MLCFCFLQTFPFNRLKSQFLYLALLSCYSALPFIQSIDEAFNGIFIFHFQCFSFFFSPSIFISILNSLSYSAFAVSSHSAVGLGSLGTIQVISLTSLFEILSPALLFGGNCCGDSDFWRSPVALFFHVFCIFAFDLVHMGKGDYVDFCCSCFNHHWKSLQCSRVSKFIRI